MSEEMTTADVLDAAADYIRVHGLAKDYRFPTHPEMQWSDNDPRLSGPCCLIGAIHRADNCDAIAKTEKSEASLAFAEFVGRDSDAYLFEWSDAHTADEVIDALMECAADLRLRGEP